MEHRIRLCTMAGGAHIAYTTMREGPALVMLPGGVSHLEVFFELPFMRAWVEALARHHMVVLYDRYGCGLSDRDRTDFTLDADVRALEAVVDALKLRRFVLFGWSAGGQAAIAYTARHPRRISHLILHGTSQGNNARRSPDYAQLWEATRAMIQAHWGLGSNTLTDIMMPEADAETRALFARACRESSTAEMAVQLLLINSDVSHLTGKLRVPTLVTHCRGDLGLPFEGGRALASAIPGAHFVPLDGNEHIPSKVEAVGPMLRTIAEFLGDPIETVETPHVHAAPGRTAAVAAAHAVFVSYAAEDRQAADAVVAALEDAGVSCWIAPRDIRPGADYAEAIVDAIGRSRALLLVLSDHANRSPHVRREVERATSADIPLIPVRIEEIVPSRSMEYFLSTAQWLNAFPGPIESYLPQLVATTSGLLTVTQTV